jgi:hypothetical protein
LVKGLIARPVSSQDYERIACYDKKGGGALGKTRKRKVTLENLEAVRKKQRFGLRELYRVQWVNKMRLDAGLRQSQWFTTRTVH